MKGGPLILAPVSAAVLVALCIALPLVFLTVVSFWHYEDYAMAPAFSLENYRTFLGPSYLPKLGQTAWMAVQAALICVALGWPAAYAVVQLPALARLPTLLALSAPFLVGEVLRIISLAVSLDATSPLAATVKDLGWIYPKFVIYSPLGTLLGLVQTWVTVPLLLGYISLGTTLRQYPAIARTLGAGPLSIAWRVLLPLNGTALAASFGIVFLASFTAWLQADFLGGPHDTSYGAAVTRQAQGIQNWPVAAVMVLATLATSLVVAGGAAAWWMGHRKVRSRT